MIKQHRLIQIHLEQILLQGQGEEFLIEEALYVVHREEEWHEEDHDLLLLKINMLYQEVLVQLYSMLLLLMYSKIITNKKKKKLG